MVKTYNHLRQSDRFVPLRSTNRPLYLALISKGVDLENGSARSI